MSYLLPLGPFHPALRGPIRLVLRVEQEVVTDLDYRDGYNERGVVERLQRVSLPRALSMVSQICGVDSHAHTLAFCLALEELLGQQAPPRAVALRTAATEVERAIAHLEVLGGLFELLGLEHDAKLLCTARGELLDIQRALCGGALITGYILPLGVRQDLSMGGRESLLLQLRRVERKLFKFIDRAIDSRGILRRTVGVGTISTSAAEQFGLVGPMARASGIQHDLRSDQPYAAYEQLAPRPIVQERGDVYSRTVVLMLEVLESVKLLVQILGQLPEGEWLGQTIEEAPAGRATAAVESARGALRYTLESDGARLTDVSIDPPRQLDRLLSRAILQGALVEDAALIVASTALCVACAEG